MSSGWIVALELIAVLGCVIGLALWDLRAMRRSDRRGGTGNSGDGGSKADRSID